MTVVIIALVWLAGTLYRIYQQARYFQIEEYQNGRYLRWLFAQRQRWLPNRPAVAWLVGTAAGFMLSEAPGEFMPGVIGTITAAIAVWPPREREVKKPFRATPRAKRLLGTAFALAILLALGSIAVTVSLESTHLRFGLVAAFGFLLFLTAPLLLILANLFMKPVEATFRSRFIARARRVLDDVQPTVIGITGSYGKTSTKSTLAHILNGRYKAYATPKSYNTLMGVCLAINNDLANDHSIEYFIAEMGAYVPGEIREICDLTRPRIAIVTEVGPQHLERFGSLENIATAKYEIIKALPPDGVGVFNWDNPHVREMFEVGYPQNRIAISRDANMPPDISANGPRLVASDIVESLDGLRFTITDHETGDSESFVTALLGIHNVTNILLATAVAIHEGMPLRDVAWRASSLQPAEARLVRQTTATGITIINDAYSTNPVGAVGALRVLGMHTTGKRLLITPGMIELGPLMDSENRKLGEVAAHYASDVILVGAQQTEPLKQGLLHAGFAPENLHIVDTLAEAIAWYQTNLKAGDAVLFLNDLPDTYTS